MRIIFITLIFSFLTIASFSQSVTIEPGTILPKMTTIQRTTIVNPLNGMLVFDTNTNSYWFYQQNAWVEMSASSGVSNFWELSGLNGNEIKNTNAGGFWSENPTTVSFDNFNRTTPIMGNGTRMMWLPTMSAFRAGTVDFDAKVWDKDSIGMHSVAFGYNTKAGGLCSVSLGHGSEASGGYSTAFGSYSRAKGTASTAIGDRNISSGYASIAIGVFNEATDLAAIALGQGTKATANMSFASGFNTEAKAYSSTSMGMYNDNSDNPLSFPPNSTDRLFQIGNGSSDNQRSNALTILRNGNMGIGRLNPTSKLEVDGQVRTTSLSFTGTNERRPVFADKDGILRVESSSNHFASYNFSAVQAQDWDDQLRKGSGYAWFNTNNTGATMYLPVNLPDGVRVTLVEMFYYDNSTSNISFTFSRNRHSSNAFTTIASAQSNTQNTSINILETDTNEVIDNYNNSYYFNISSVGNWTGNTLQFHSLVITYQYQ